MKKVCTEKAPKAIGPYSQAIVVKDMVYTSGQIPLNAEGVIVGKDIKEQTEQVMKNLSAVLEEAGSSLDNAVKTTCYLANIEDFANFNEVYAQYIKNSPARSCVAVKNLPKGALVEVDVVAVL